MLGVTVLNKEFFPRFLRIIAIVSGALISIAVTGCDAMPASKVIDEGEFEGIRIGEPKQVVLEILQKRGIKRVQVRDSDQRLVENAERLIDLIEANRLVVTDYAATAVTLDFSGDVVAKSVVSANIPEDLNASFQEGATKEQAFSAIAVLMNENDRLEAFDAIPEVSSSYVGIEEVSESGYSLLMKYDIWFYTMLDRKPFPAAVLLYFEGHDLVRIEYKENYGY